MLEDIVKVRRRMVANKFSNRPPFYLKDEQTVNKQSPSLYSKNIRGEKTMKSICEIRESKRNSAGNQTMSSNSRKLNSIIPKVIESFQKVTPKVDSNYMDSSQDSLKTLFRNSNLSFGKHIPDHAAMKNLLHNFDVEKKRDKVAYQVIDVVPTKYSNTRCRVVMKKPSEKKLDKATSTGDLVSSTYGPNLNQYCLNENILPRKHSKTNHRKRIDVTIETTNNSVKLDFLPNTSKNDNNRNEQVKKCTKCKGIRQGTFVVENNPVANPKNSREKSFVKTQVEKLNAIYGRNAQVKSAPVEVKRLGSRKFSYTHPIEVN